MNYALRFDWMKLQEACAAILERNGVPQKHAAVVAESLVHADLRGIESHGVSRLPIYVERIKKKLIHPDREVAKLLDNGSTILLDGRNQLGAVVGNAALREVLSRAEQTGIAMAGVRHSNHFGACSYYAEKAIQAGQILIVLSNAPQSMAPIGGIRPFLGSNPLAIGIPGKYEAPFLLDMATSTVARGKIALAEKEGKSIPEGWAIGADGQPTTNPAEALLGSILPFGEAKGYGLALFIDILCGLLTGAGFADQVYSLYDNWDHPQNIGHIFISIHIDHFVSYEKFTQSMEQYCLQLKAEPTVAGVSEILIPGEREYRCMIACKQEGIPLGNATAAELQNLAKAHQVDLNRSIIHPQKP